MELKSWIVGEDLAGALVVEREGAPGTVLIKFGDAGISVCLQDDSDEKNSVAETYATWPELEREYHA